MEDDLAELTERLRTVTIAHGSPAGKAITDRSDCILIETLRFLVFRAFGDYAHSIGDFLDVTPDTVGS